jgi:hypothetical protein
MALPLQSRVCEAQDKMTLKIEKVSDAYGTTIRLIGRMQAVYLDELQAQIRESTARVTLDLREVSLVDVEAVRFLGNCRDQGIHLLHCSPYIEDWVEKERWSKG